MSKQYPGGFIIKSPPVPAGNLETSAAAGVWTLDQAMYWIKQGQWPTAGNTNPWFSVSSLGSQSNAIVTNSSGEIIYGYSYTGDAFALVNNAGAIASAGAYLAYNQNDGDVYVDSNDNIYTCTWNATSLQKWYVAKYNSSGANVWAKSVDFTTDYFRAPKIGVDSSGNVYLCGARSTTSNTDYRLCVVKLDSSGTFVWARYYQLFGTTTDIYSCSGPIFDSSSNLIIALRLSTSSIAVCTLTPSGSFNSGNEYTNFILDGGSGGGLIVKDASGNIYISGQRVSPNQPALLKLNSSYAVVWAYYINDPSGNFFRTSGSGLAIDPTTNDVYLGNFYLFNSPSRACVARITSSGTLSWIRSIGVSTNITRSAVNKALAAYGSKFYYAVSNQTLSTSPLIFSAMNDGGITGTVGNYSSNAITSSLTALSPSLGSISLSATSITPTVSTSTSTSVTPTFTKTSL